MIYSLTVKHTQKTRPHTVISLEASQQLFLTDNDPNEFNIKLEEARFTLCGSLRATVVYYHIWSPNNRQWHF